MTITVQSLLKAKWEGGGANEWVQTGKKCSSCRGRIRRRRGSIRRVTSRGRFRRRHADRRRCIHTPCTCKTKPVYSGEWKTTVDDVVFTIKRADGVIAAYADTELGSVYSDDRKDRRTALEDVVTELRKLVQRTQLEIAKLSVKLW